MLWLLQLLATKVSWPMRVCECIMAANVVICVVWQVAALQKDNTRLRSDLDHELNSRQMLQVQVENKEQLINSLRGQLETRLNTRSDSPSGRSVHRDSSPVSIRLYCARYR